MTLSSAFALVGFVVVLLVVAMGGAMFRPGAWYETIEKPSWTPPNWVFPAVWTPLYLMIAVSGWLAFRHAGLSPALFAAYAVQLVLNFVWSALFFGLRRADLAFVDVVGLWLAILVNIVVFAGVSAWAAWLLVPYLVWVTIAACLNRAVWRLNPQALAGA